MSEHRPQENGDFIPHVPWEETSPVYARPPVVTPKLACRLFGHRWVNGKWHWNGPSNEWMCSTTCSRCGMMSHRIVPSKDFRH